MAEKYILSSLSRSNHNESVGQEPFDTDDEPLIEGAMLSDFARTGSDLDKIPDLSWVNTILLRDVPYKCSALRALRGAVGLFVSARGNDRCFKAALSHVHMAFFVCSCTHASVRQMEHRCRFDGDSEQVGRHVGCKLFPG